MAVADPTDTDLINTLRFITCKVVDLRISIMPSIHGESVVIRLLDSQFAMAGLEDLGFSGDDAARLRHLLTRNNGVFPVTGPTGSGKSTTLYTALAQIRRRNVNIITVEDPVEYPVDGITQVEVDPSIRPELKVTSGETFYRGKGCEHCHDTGVHGRRAVYELLTVSSP